MAAKSYKQLYEETKRMLNIYQDEVVPKLRAQLEALPQSQSQEQSQPITEEEIFALKAVAHGCNTNRNLNSVYGSTFLEIKTNKTVSFKDALITVYKLIERLSK